VVVRQGVKSREKGRNSKKKNNGEFKETKFLSLPSFGSFYASSNLWRLRLFAGFLLKISKLWDLVIFILKILRTWFEARICRYAYDITFHYLFAFWSTVILLKWRILFCQNIFMNSLKNFTEISFYNSLSVTQYEPGFVFLLRHISHFLRDILVICLTVATLLSKLWWRPTLGLLFFVDFIYLEKF